jgi:hypothetical protein
VSYKHNITSSKYADFMIDAKYTFEVCGALKPLKKNTGRTGILFGTGHLGQATQEYPFLVVWVFVLIAFSLDLTSLKKITIFNNANFLE